MARPVFFSAHGDEARQALVPDVMIRPVRKGPGFPEPGDGAVDDLRVDPARGFEVDAQFLQDAGPEAFDDDVRRLHQFQKGLFLPRVLQIEGHAFFIAVHFHEPAGHTAAPRFETAGIIPARRFLYLNHISAHVGHHAGAERAGQQARKVQDTYISQRSHRESLLFRHFVYGIPSVSGAPGQSPSVSASSLKKL